MHNLQNAKWALSNFTPDLTGPEAEELATILLDFAEYCDKAKPPTGNFWLSAADLEIFADEPLD